MLQNLNKNNCPSSNDEPHSKKLIHSAQSSFHSSNNASLATSGYYSESVFNIHSGPE